MVGIRSIMALAVAFGLAGCAPSPLVGRYVGKRIVGGPPHIRGTAEKVELELKADGRFTLLNLSIPYEGSWESSASGAVLKIERAVGQAQPPGYKMYLTRADRSLTLDDPAGLDKSPVTLTRSEN